MEAGPSRFGRGRLSVRRERDTYKKEDDWYIPYKPPTTHTNTYTQGGPSSTPARASNQVFSFFSASSGLDSNFNPSYSTQPYNTANGIARLDPRRPYRSPSYSSLTDRPPNPLTLPSSTSVPTGLAGPKMLFSPLHREMRSAPSPPYAPDPDLGEYPRRRIQSTPKSSRPGGQRWAAQTMCDLLVFPRPNITPHTITPPGSPSDRTENVLEMGQLRLKEREEWARTHPNRKKSLSRGRSLSLGRSTPPEGAPIIGSAQARREEADERERRRSSSASRPKFGRLRSSSLGMFSSSDRGDEGYLGRKSSERSTRSRRSGRGLSSCGLSKNKSEVDLGFDPSEYSYDPSLRG